LKLIKDSKVNTSIEDITSELPEEYYEYLKYCRNLGYETTPDYEELIKTFEKLLNKNYSNDKIYDWFQKKVYKKINKKDYYDYNETKILEEKK